MGRRGSGHRIAVLQLLLLEFRRNAIGKKSNSDGYRPSGRSFAHWQARDQDWLIVNLDRYTVIAGLFKPEVANFVDQVDPLHRAFGLELAHDDFFGIL